MATMEPSNKSGKKKHKNRKHTQASGADGRMCPAAKSEEKMDVTADTKSALHAACFHRRLAAVGQLVEPSQSSVNSGDLRGRRPLHVTLSPQSSPNTSLRLQYLLEQGADINAKTDSGMTPLHSAASEGLLDCVEALVRAGADVLAQDNVGNTPLDLARIGGHREAARHLRSHMWHEAKKKELRERKLARDVYRDLVREFDMDERSKRALCHEKMAEWASKKGFPPMKDLSQEVPVSQYHTRCFPSDVSGPTLRPSTLPLRQKPPAPDPRPVPMGLPPEKPPSAPDLRDGVAVRGSGGGGHLAKRAGAPRRLPDLPADVLERVLFPSRLASPRRFEPRGIAEVQHRRRPPGRTASPWTEVAMHLAEALEPGRY